MEQCNNDSGTVEQLLRNSGTEMVEHWASDGGTMEQ